MSLLETPSTESYRRPRTQSDWGLWLVVGLVCVVLGSLLRYGLNSPVPIHWEQIPPQTASEGTLFTIPLHAQPGIRSLKLNYRMISGPRGASLDSRSGLWQWRPGESDGGSTVRVQVGVTADSTPLSNATVEFPIHVAETYQPLQVMPLSEESQIQSAALPWSLPITALQRDLPAAPLAFRLADPIPSGLQIGPHSGQLSYVPTEPVSPQEIEFTVEIIRPACPLCRAAVRKFRVDLHTDESATDLVLVEQNSPSPEHRPVMQPLPGSQTSPSSGMIQELTTYFRAGSLAERGSYPGLRRIFAAEFERLHPVELKAVFDGEDGARFRNWLEQHPSLRDELYTAITPQDDPLAVLQVLKALQADSFQTVQAYPELSLAISLTWDQPQHLFPDDYHQKRSHALPSREQPMTAVETLQEYTDSGRLPGTRLQRSPWEFLIHVVNHRTPRSERDWVRQNYIHQRQQIGRCYDDVAYDHGMIKSGESTSNMAGQQYTLPNLRARGGVCSMQADYAARVAKCLGIPAAYVEGTARVGARHAWVIWTEARPSTGSELAFQLESHGRFQIDRYYVGQLRDPQTGRTMTDRALELHLHAVSLDPVAYRQACSIMRFYPQLKPVWNLTLAEQLAFLEALLALSPGCESVWRELAQLAPHTRDDDTLRKRFEVIRDRSFQTFTNCPDFLCELVPNMLSFEPDLTRRRSQLESLAQQWEISARPDLSCQVQLILARQLQASGLSAEALSVLSRTMKKFADDGRQVPQLMQQFETMASGLTDGDQRILKMYQELLPQIPRRRYNQPSLFRMQMLRQAASRFRAAGLVKQADGYESQLAAHQKELDR